MLSMTEAGSLIPLLWPFPVGMLAAAVLLSFAAGVLRGFAGFGYSAVVVAGLAPFVAPGPLVLAVLALEALASLRAMRQVADQVDRRWLRAILIGHGIFVPLGVSMLAALPMSTLRVAISGALLLGALAVRRATRVTLQPGPALRAATGAASGLLTGLAGSGGVIAALMMAAAAVPASVVRATMVNALLWMSLYSLGWTLLLAAAGVDRFGIPDALRWFIVLWPTMALGVRIGASAFGRSDPAGQKTLVLNVLIIACAAGLLTGALRLLLAGQ